MIRDAAVNANPAHPNSSAQCQTPVIVALDFDQPNAALSLLTQLDPRACRVKIGKELFAVGGPELVKQIVARGFDVFLDLKYHDIPTTVAKACAAAAQLGVWMLNVHASGGSKMMQAAQAALAEFHPRPLLIGVTVLTSMEDQDLAEMGIHTSAQEQVVRLARLAQDAELDGVVCSAHEASLLKHTLGDSFCLVTPGIRPACSQNQDDQKRIMTPRQALAAGADYLVIGRPITQANDPQAALEAILADIGAN